jgi:hypothetical protein
MPEKVRDPKGKLVDPDTAKARQHGMDKTVADSFPASDPPSSIPDPELEDSECPAEAA